MFKVKIHETLSHFIEPIRRFTSTIAETPIGHFFVVNFFPSSNEKYHSERVYRNRFFLSVAIVLIQIIAVFTFWPTEQPEYDRIVYETSDQVVFVEDVEITQHGSKPPPPPKPFSPVPVPSDQIIEDEIELPDMIIEDVPDFGLEEFALGSDAGSSEIVGNPARAPSVVKIVEPVFPKEAQKAKLKAIVSVSFVVGLDGNVEDVSVSEIKMYNEETKKFEITTTLGFGLVDATIKAAARWKFRPARDKGREVRAYARHEFTFGM